MPGLADVAARAGVAKATASRALTGTGYVSDATRDRVLTAAQELGYVPSTSAVTLATGRTGSVGVLMPHVNRWFFAEVLEGIQQALLERGLDLVLYDAKPGSAGRERIFREFLARGRYDGLIAVGVEPATDELQRLLDLGHPVVLVVGDPALASVVEVDDDDLMRRATEHLAHLGHTAIAFLGTPDDIATAPRVERRRHRAYVDAMTSLGLAHKTRHVPAETSIPGGYAAAVELLGDSRTRPTAIVAVCDEVAVGAIIAARRLGIGVPGALSVVGVDDHEYAEMFALTTFYQDPRAQGVRAVEILLSEIADPDSPRTVVEELARLIVRNSTSALDPLAAPVVRDTGLLTPDS